MSLPFPKNASLQTLFTPTIMLITIFNPYRFQTLKIHPTPHTASSSHFPLLNFPPLIPYLHPKYPPTPTKFPNPAPPNRPLHPFPRATNAPATVPTPLQVSTSTCPLFASSRQLRSLHSMSSFPYILPASASAINPVPATVPTPADLSTASGRGCFSGRNSMVGKGAKAPKSAPAAKPRYRTWPVRMAWG